MTKKQKLLKLIEDETNLDPQTVAAVFEIYNEKRWKIFVSQMGDYDHPCERIEAEKKFAEKSKELDSNAVGKVVECLSRENGAGMYYWKNFHELEEEECI